MFVTGLVYGAIVFLTRGLWGAIVFLTRGLWGAIRAHALANIALYLVLPFGF